MTQAEGVVRDEVVNEPRPPIRRRSVLGGAAGVGGSSLAVLGFGGSAWAANLAGGAEAGPPAASSPTALTQQAANGVDPQMKEVLDALAALNPLPIETLVPRQARELPSFTDAVQLALARRGQAPAVEEVGRIDHLIIPGGPGSDGTLVRVYTPASGSGPFPVLVYFHGGGWVIANLNVYDGSARALTNATGCVVVSVAYRQAPENPFPAAVEDAYAAYQWVRGNAAQIDGDPARVAVGGESAGGNLAAVTARLARERGLTVPVHQLLVYPVTDFNLDYPSFQEQAAAKPLSTPLVQWFGRYYLRSEADAVDPSASPIRAADLRGLPSATVITAEIDPLRDEGEAYAVRLRQATVPVVSRRYNGVTHEFFGAGAVVDQAKDAVALAATQLKSAFAS